MGACTGDCNTLSSGRGLCAGTTRWVMLGTTGIALAGLLKLNLQGPGVIATVKQLWKKEQPKVIA